MKCALGPCPREAEPGTPGWYWFRLEAPWEGLWGLCPEHDVRHEGHPAGPKPVQLRMFEEVR